MNTKRLLMVTFTVLLFSGCSKTNDEYIQDLYSDSTQERMMAAATLMRRGNDSKTVRSLIDILNEDNEQAKFISVQILGALADTSYIPSHVDGIHRFCTHIPVNILRCTEMPSNRNFHFLPKLTIPG